MAAQLLFNLSVLHPLTPRVLCQVDSAHLLCLILDLTFKHVHNVLQTMSLSEVKKYDILSSSSNNYYLICYF